MTITELSEILRDCGVAGAGGAGFPTYAKLSDKADTIILNCAECEPLLTLHQQVMAEYCCEILEAMHTVAEVLGASDMIIALQPSYKAAVQALEAELPRFQDKHARLCLLPPAYPVGDEIITIYQATGRMVEPGKLPITVGCIVNNVETMLNAYYAITEHRPVTEKFITITGAVVTPVTVKVPLGVTVKEVLALAGGPNISNYAIVAGGPMTGTICLETDVVTKTSNAYIVLPESHYVVQRKTARTAVSVQRAMSTCCHCNICTSLCSRNLVGYPIDPGAFMTALSAGASGNVKPYLDTFFCSACGLCEMYACFQSLSPATLISQMKAGLRQQGVKPPEAKLEPVNLTREYRLVDHNRLTARLNLSKYHHPAPLTDSQPSYKSLKIMLGQHIGAPAEPLVKKGDRVTAGQKIAETPAGKLGLALHAPRDGQVAEVADRYIKLTL